MVTALPPPLSNSQAFLSLRNRHSLATYLNLAPNLLTYFLYGPPKTHLYREFAIRKRSGQPRKILAPIKPLKLVQQKLATVLSELYKPRACVYGFVSDRGIWKNAHRHVGQRWLLRVDLRDFFPSINFGRIRGLFLAAPFSFPPEVATVLAQLTTHENELPQGAPTSPVLSNFICRRLDRKLTTLAQDNRCYYTRYADDLIFSTNLKHFPQEFASLDTSQGITKTVMGVKLHATIQSEGFSANEDKVYLRGTNAQKLCTGLVVNEFVNIPRTYVRRTRAMLYYWKRFGLDDAGKYFFEIIDKRNRSRKPPPADYRYVVRGIVQYIGSVKGWNNPIYLKLAASLRDLDSSFQPKVLLPAPSGGEIRVFTEGKTDLSHLESALSYFQERGIYRELDLDLSPSGLDGDDQLLKHCRAFSLARQARLTVFLFDHDKIQIVNQVTNRAAKFKYWNNRVYSAAIPVPRHRPDLVCMEMYYQDADIKRMDSNGRRLFLLREFRDNGFHLSEPFIWTNHHKGTLVVDEDVYDLSGTSVVLSKVKFATYISNKTAPFDNMDFTAFREIFDVFIAILQDDSKTNS